MPPTIHVAIHPSQFPQRVRSDLLQSLRSRQMDHKFHYESVKQAQAWLAVHRAYSPFQRDPGVAAIYTAACRAVVDLGVAERALHLIGLGCGGGEKDSAILDALRSRGESSSVDYTPCDVSLPLVLLAHQRADSLVATDRMHPLVCDLVQTRDLGEVIAASEKDRCGRIVTFFGLLPNFAPPDAREILRRVVRPGDFLLVSANLAPGPDYDRGVAQVLRLYDNAATRDWLLISLLDLGVEREDGELGVSIEACPHGSGLKRIAARFRFRRERELRIGDEAFQFVVGDEIGLFFSYRHTRERVRGLFESDGFSVVRQWISESQEEGVFLCRRN